MSDPLNGIRPEATEDEATELLQAFMHIRNEGLDRDTIALYQVGIEAAARIESDRVLSFLVNTATDTLRDLFHEWVHTNLPEELERIRFQAKVHKSMVDTIFTLVKTADDIDEQIANDGENR